MRWLGLHKIESTDQRLRAMADVLELLMFDTARAHGQGGGRAFQCLNAGHLVDRQRLDAGAGPLESEAVRLADIVAFLIKALIVLGRQPAAYPMRLQAGIFLKSARWHAVKSTRRCPV